MPKITPWRKSIHSRGMCCQRAPGLAQGCSRRSASLSWPARGLRGWAVVRGKGFSCGWKGCWVSRGDVQSSGASGPSTAEGLEGRDPHTTGLGARHPAQAPAQPRLHLSLKHLSCPWFLRVGDGCRATPSGIFDGCPAGLGVPGHRAATATALQPGSTWVVCSSCVSWHGLQAPGPCFFCTSRRTRNSVKKQEPQELGL